MIIPRFAFLCGIVDDVSAWIVSIQASSQARATITARPAACTSLYDYVVQTAPTLLVDARGRPRANPFRSADVARSRVLAYPRPLPLRDGTWRLGRFVLWTPDSHDSRGYDGAFASLVHDMPPSGLGLSSWCGDESVRPDITGTWLELVATPPSQVWTDRTKEICKLREQGETLASIGQRFGLSAERVRQILLDEGPYLPASVGAERAPDDNVESACQKGFDS